MDRTLIEQLIVFAVAFLPLFAFLVQTGMRYRVTHKKKGVPVAVPVTERRIRIRTQEEINKEVQHDWENKLRREQGLPVLPLPDELAWIYSDDEEIRFYGPKKPVTVEEIRSVMKPLTTAELYDRVRTKYAEMNKASASWAEEKILPKPTKIISLSPSSDIRRTRELIEEVKSGKRTREDALAVALRERIGIEWYDVLDIGTRAYKKKEESLEYTAPKNLTGHELRKWAWKRYQIVDRHSDAEPYQRYSHYTKWLGEQQRIGRFSSSQYNELMGDAAKTTLFANMHEIYQKAWIATVKQDLRENEKTLMKVQERALEQKERDTKQLYKMMTEAHKNRKRGKAYDR